MYNINNNVKYQKIAEFFSCPVFFFVKAKNYKYDFNASLTPSFRFEFKYALAI